MPITYIIVEDEPLASEKVKEFAGRVPYLRLVGEFHKGMDALRFLKENLVDLVFLDIEMEDLSGIELTAALATRPHIIITTAYDRYAVKGYELAVTDYLLKPYRFDRFLQAVEKVYEQRTASEGHHREFIFVQSEYRNVKIFIRDIFYIEGMRDYRGIQLDKQRVMTLQTFQQLESMLPEEKLLRVHKSYMVALDKIEFIERNQIKVRDKLIPLSETYRSRFYSLTGLKER